MGAFRATMHRVLTIPELLDTIFRALDTRSNLVNALVCRSWSEIALDALWRHVDDLHQLFSLLAPLRESSSSGLYEFSRLPESSDWTRFQKYAKRVRVLEHDEAKVRLHQTVFDDIARTRTSLNILPNMHTLDWRASITLCIMFMHSNVKRFAIHLPDDIGDISLRPFFDDVLSRMPRLVHIDIRTNIPMNILESETIRLLSSLPDLQKVTTPRFFFTSRLANCLSLLPKLGCIEFQYFARQGVGDPADVAVFHPELSEGAFPALWDLSLTAAYGNVQGFLTMPFSPSNLTMLYIESPILESPPHILQLLTAISENCQMLKILAFISRRAGNTGNDADRGVDSNVVDGLDAKDSSNQVTIETLKPIFSCSNLISLEIIHHHPLSLCQSDLEVLALRWPTLETLNLNTEPYDFSSAHLTLEALLPFAQHCPHLIYLGLFIDASLGSIPSFNAKAPLPAFKRLQRLAMGLSVIESSTPVTVFLSQILPAGCQIDSGIIWDDFFHVDHGAEEIIGRRFELWESVNNLLPVLTRVRAEERERTKELKKELSDLQIRTRILTEKFGNLVGAESADSCVML